MNIVEKLMLAKQLSFSDGTIGLLNVRAVIIPGRCFSEYMLKINDSPEKVSEFYDSMKFSFSEGIAKEIGKAYGFDFENFFRWFTDLANMTGWGTFKWEKFEKEEKQGILTNVGSPVAEDLKGKVKSPVDHVIRAFIAGGVSAGFNSDIDVVEDECAALGAPQCKFRLVPHEAKH